MSAEVWSALRLDIVNALNFNAQEYQNTFLLYLLDLGLRYRLAIAILIGGRMGEVGHAIITIGVDIVVVITSTR